MPQPSPAQLGVDGWRAVTPPAGGEDAADLLAQLGFRLGTALDGGDRVEPSVEAADARTDDSAQRGHGVIRPLGRYEGELRHAIPLAKKAAALRRISTSSSSRFTSRFSRCVSACSALRTASASAEPAARCSVRHWLSCPVPMPSSVATSDSPLPPSSSRFTACALNSLVKLRRVRLSAILPSWGAWFVSKPSSPRGEVQGAVVRYREIEAEQLQDRADQPLGLAQRQAEHGLERQGRGDRQIGVRGLSAPGGA